MKKAMIRFALLLAFAMLPMLAARAAVPWLPAQGPYWNQSEHGIYYHLSVGPDGFLFAALTLYRPDGSPTFLVMQGHFEPTPWSEWSSTGVTGRLRSPLYRMEGGACLDCAVPPTRVSRTIASEFGDAEIEFRNDGRAAFRHAGRTTPIAHYPLYNSAASLPRNRLGGRWQLRYVGDTLSGPADLTAEVEIGRTTGVRSTGGGPADFGIGDFSKDEVLSLECVDCRRGQTQLGLPNFLAAKDDGTLRVYSQVCSRVVCNTPLRGIVHERDGTLLVRSVDDNGHPFEMTLQRMGDRCGPHHDDCQSHLGPPSTVTWTPPAGLWWDGSGGGVFYHVGVGPGGFLFVAITSFQPSGEPTFLVMQGEFEPTTLSQWAQSGEIGRLRSPLYRMSGGQALGGTYRDPTVTPSELGNAEIVFSAGGHAEFRRSGASIALSTYPLYDTAAGLPENRLQGEWVAMRIVGGVAHATGLVEIGPADASQRLRVRCVDCDVQLGSRLGSNAELRLDAEPWPLFVLEGDRASATAPAFEFHERDGVLYGRTARVRLAEVSPDLHFALNSDIILARVGPVRTRP